VTLTEFLLARITEDEAEVGHVEKGSWADEGAGPNGVGWADVGANNDVLMARPSRVLAECEAKRRIVAGAVRPEDPWQPGTVIATDSTLRLLALPFADHPDYDETWRP